MQNLLQKIKWLPMVVTIFFAIGVIGIGSYHTWPNLESINESRSRWSGIWNAWEQALISTDGRYATDFLHCINPVALGYTLGYKIMPFTVAALFVFSGWFFMATFISAAFPRLLFVLLFAAVHFALSPNITNQLFHMAGCFVHMYCICFWLLWTGAAIRCYTYNDKKSSWWFLMAAFFLFASFGTNEGFLVVNVITLFVLLCIAYLHQALLRVMSLVAVGIIAILFFFACSGSSQRIALEAQFHQSGYLKSEVTYYLLHYGAVSKGLFMNSLLLFPAFLLLGFSLPIKAEAARFFGGKKNALLLLLMLAGIFAALTLPFYLFKGSGGVFPARIFIPVVFFLQLLCMLGVFLIAIAVPALPAASHKYQLIFSLWLVVAITMGQNNYTQMLQEYRSGSYTQYNNDSYESYKILMQASNSTTSYKFAEVPDFPKMETLIYSFADKFLEVSNDRNRVLEIYYRVDEVKFRSDTASKKELVHRTICNTP